MEEVQFFNALLIDTGQAFNLAPIKEYQETINKNWNYAICETPIRKGKGIIFGLNWGGDNHNPQSEYPKPAKEERAWNFMSHSRSYFSEYLEIKDIDDVNYSNLCFFRSPNIKDLKPQDWNLSIPLFKKYVDYIEPKWTVLLGKTGVSKLNQYGHLTKLNKISIQGKSKRTFGYTGIIFDKYRFCCVPHPQAKIETSVRKEIWHQLFNIDKG